MKYQQEEEIVVSASTETSSGIHVPPRYNQVEFTVQLIDGAGPYDVLIQGLEDYPTSAEMYGSPSPAVTAASTDWIDLYSESGVTTDFDFTSFPSSYGYYRASITAAGSVTVTFYVVGITSASGGGGGGGVGVTGATGPMGLPGLDGSIGRDGLDGATGVTGPAGANGLPGMDGLNGARGPMGPQGPQGDGDVAQLDLEMDDTEAGTLYVGEANPGSNPAVAEWRIKRIVETGPDLSIEWADGDANFDNVWNDRLSLSYD